MGQIKPLEPCKITLNKFSCHVLGTKLVVGVSKTYIVPNQTSLRACLYGGGGPQVGGVTRLFIQSLILI